MAIIYYVVKSGNYSATCLEADTFPLNPPDDSDLTIIETGKIYRSLGGEWIPAVPVVLQNNRWVDVVGSDVFPFGDGTIINPYRTIQFAIDSVSGATPLNPYIINIGIGTFVEDITLTNGISLVGLSRHILDVNMDLTILSGNVTTTTTTGSTTDNNFSSIDFDGVNNYIYATGNGTGATNNIHFHDCVINSSLSGTNNCTLTLNNVNLNHPTKNISITNNSTLFYYLGLASRGLDIDNSSALLLGSQPVYNLGLSNIKGTVTLLNTTSQLAYLNAGTNLLSTNAQAAITELSIRTNNLQTSGTSVFNSLSATTLSGGTILSGGTDLYNIFATLSSEAAQVQSVRAGANIRTTGTQQNPIVNLIDSLSISAITTSGLTTINSDLIVTGNTSVQGLSAVTLSATTLSANTFNSGVITSGGTNLYSIFAQVGGEVIAIGNGTNTTTGGTISYPVINIISSPSFNSLTTSGATLISSTLTVTGNTSVQGLTVVTLSATILSANTFNANTITSGGTNLYNIFQIQGSSVLNVNAGSNITTGGTAQSPIINLTASPSVNAFTVSGATLINSTLTVTGNTNVQGLTATTFSANTLSATTIISGSTNIDSIFTHQAGYLFQKAGNISGSTFSGTPQKAIVSFVGNFSSANYAPIVSSDTNRSWTIESISSSGFTINANSNATFAPGNVYWIAMQIGEGQK